MDPILIKTLLILLILPVLVGIAAFLSKTQPTVPPNADPVTLSPKNRRPLSQSLEDPESIVAIVFPQDQTRKPILSEDEVLGGWTAEQVGDRKAKILREKRQCLI